MQKIVMYKNSKHGVQYRFVDTLSGYGHQALPLNGLDWPCWCLQSSAVLTWFISCHHLCSHNLVKCIHYVYILWIGWEGEWESEHTICNLGLDVHSTRLWVNVPLSVSQQCAHLDPECDGGSEFVVECVPQADVVCSQRHLYCMETSRALCLSRQAHIHVFIPVPDSMPACTHVEIYWSTPSCSSAPQPLPADRPAVCMTRVAQALSQLCLLKSGSFD